MFADFFHRDGAPRAPNVHIEGFTFPVEEKYLEDALELTGLTHSQVCVVHSALCSQIYVDVTYFVPVCFTSTCFVLCAVCFAFCALCAVRCAACCVLCVFILCSVVCGLCYVVCALCFVLRAMCYMLCALS